MTRRTIPYTISHGANRPVIFIEMWPGKTEAGEPGTGHLRTFDAADWARAACYLIELKRGHLTGEH